MKLKSKQEIHLHFTYTLQPEGNFTQCFQCAPFPLGDVVLLGLQGCTTVPGFFCVVFGSSLRICILIVT
jgi:hypothetical protein